MKRLKYILLLPLLFTLTSCMEDLVASQLYQYKLANNDDVVSEDPPAPMQKMDVTDEAGNRTVGWYYKYAGEYSANAPLVIYFHGNGENLLGTYGYGFGEKMISLKVNFAIFDYPKYGLSTGETTEAGVVASAQAAFDFLKQKFPNSPIIIWGRSLGCAPATIIAERNQSQVEKLILTSPWDSFWKIVKYNTNLSDKMCHKLAIGNEFETEVHARNITLPVLIHHGTKDKVVPYERGKNLAGAFAGSDVTFVSVEGADHENLLQNKEWEEISHFIKY